MKKVLYVIIGILVLYLVLALFGPKQIKVERQVSINRPSQFIKEKLGDFKFFHDSWSPWTDKDSAMQTTYEGTPGIIGHHYSWKGNKDVGSGSMELMSFNNDTILMKLSFEGEGDAKAYFLLKDNNASTDVTWGMIFDVGFMGRPVMLFMNMDKMLGADYEKGLAKLKTTLESMNEAPATANYDIMEMNWDEKTFVGTKRTKMNGQNLGMFYGENFPKLGADMTKAKIQPEMAPCALVYSWDEKTMDCECAAVMCVQKGKTIQGWETHAVPASKVLHIAYYGSYEKSVNAHMAMGKYLSEKGLTQQLVVEEYVTDPVAEKDTSKWLTNIYYVLK